MINVLRFLAVVYLRGQKFNREEANQAVAEALSDTGAE